MSLPLVIEQDTLLGALFSSSSSAQMIVDPFDNHIIAANRACCRLLHSDLPSLQSVRPSDLFRSRYAQFLVFCDEALQLGHAWSESQYVEIAADLLRLDITAHLVQHRQRRLLHFSMVDADALELRRDHTEAQRHYRSGLTHWSRVAQVFQEFERENQLILDAAGEGIYGVDAEGLTTFINPAAERILGYRSAELAGKSMHSVIHHTHGDGSEFHVHDCPIYQSFCDGTVHLVEDDVFWAKTGEAVAVEYTSTPIRDNGCLVGAVIVFRDVTQKKADERRLRAALAEVESLKNRLQAEKQYLQEEINSEFNHHHIVGKSPAIQKVIQQIELVAPTDATVMVTGESGTGKELIARATHELSSRSERPLIRVNCAAIPAELFESEFFGHTKGAFTGATSDRPGRFELADGGTLFLDEVGEIPLHLQGKLLRVLQEQQFERVGESKTHLVDVRIIAATNQDLERLVEQGKFREDLYFRLNVFPIESVPLRKRVEDIPLLAQHFLSRAGNKVNKSGLKIPLSQLARLQSYSWPGNIRELENVIERQVILAQGDKLSFSDLQIDSSMAQLSVAPLVESADREFRTDRELRSGESDNLRLALRKSNGKVSGRGGAAELLGVKPTTLASRIKRYRIDVRDFKRP